MACEIIACILSGIICDCDPLTCLCTERPHHHINVESDEDPRHVALDM